MFDLLARLPHPRYRRTLQRFANLQHQSCPTLRLALDGKIWDGESNLRMSLLVLWCSITQPRQVVFQGP